MAAERFEAFLRILPSRTVQRRSSAGAANGELSCNDLPPLARLLDIPGGEQIVKKSYAQMRKVNCWNISIVQQYSRFKEDRIRSAVFGNSRRFF